jgi:hypothetical protein
MSALTKPRRAIPKESPSVPECTCGLEICADVPDGSGGRTERSLAPDGAVDGNDLLEVAAVSVSLRRDEVQANERCVLALADFDVFGYAGIRWIV